MSKESTALFALPSWAEGAGRLVDFGGTLDVYNVHPTGSEADADALRRDWCAVGLDLIAAVRKVTAQQRS